MRLLFIRSGIILFWTALIAACLYWPSWKFIQYEQNTLNIFSWGNILDPAIIDDFQEKTGIQVNLSYYSSNEELIVKLRATEGKGYDLIIPSDYAVNILSTEGLLKKIDPEQLHFWDKINPNLMNHFFDPHNQYSIPFEWEIYGLGIDNDYFKLHPTPPSWKMLFDPTVVDYKITMINDPIEAVQFAAFYLYGATPTIDMQQADAVRALLKQQKPWVEAYADFRGDYFLATKNCAVILASRAYVLRTMRLYDFVGFVVPQEGTFITIENLCIPQHSDKDFLTYQFINFLYTPKSVISHYKTHGFFPATLKAEQIAPIDPQAAQILKDAEEDFKRYHFFSDSLLPQDQIRDIWVDVKSGT